MKVWQGHHYLCILVTVVFLSIFPPSHSIAGSRNPSPVLQIPNKIVLPLVAEIQLDDYSCGLHSLSAIYRSHGLDPEKAQLEKRLGTNVAAIPLVYESKGTIQPDIFRVLNQDGFATESLDRFTPENLRKIRDHLDSGYYVLALFKFEYSIQMHWVVLTGRDGTKVTVADSLRRKPYQLDLETFAEKKLLNTILISPSIPQPGSPYFRAHAYGFKNMLTSTWDITPVHLRVLGIILLLLGILVLKNLLLVLRKRWTWAIRH